MDLESSKSRRCCGRRSVCGRRYRRAIQNMISMVRDLVDATMEYNRIMASLEILVSISRLYPQIRQRRHSQHFTEFWEILSLPQQRQLTRRLSDTHNLTLQISLMQLLAHGRYMEILSQLTVLQNRSMRPSRPELLPEILQTC